MMMLRRLVPVVVRPVHRCYVRQVGNPGIDRRARALDIQKQSELEEDALDSYEADFNQANYSHKEHRREMAANRERIQSLIVKRKYFKAEAINFLTWAEKEQIRSLHADNADEWTIERLAESFPATEETIAKMVRNRWLPKSSKRVDDHDAAVQKSWDLFRAAQLNDTIDPAFAAHLQKFSHRQITGKLTPVVERQNLFEMQKPTKGEFTSIITSCKGYDSSLQLNSGDQSVRKSKHFHENLPPPKDDMFVVDKVDDRKPVTLGMLRQKYQLHKTDQVEDNLNDRVDINKQSEVISLDSNDFPTIFKAGKELPVKTTASERPTDIRPIAGRNRLRIPKQLWKRGGTYRLDDCFYDDDGEFLYRVPGMIGK